MELVSLELDWYAKKIGDYFEEELRMPIRRVKHKSQKIHRKYYQKSKVCRLVDIVLRKGYARKLVLYGSGSYHHYTYGLCKRVDKFSKNYAYIHFDHHSDTWTESTENLTCAAFVKSILKDTNASAVLYIGNPGPSDTVVPGKSLGIAEYGLREEGGFEKLESGLASLPQDVYLSFDLDVMPPFLIKTGFWQGSLKLEELMKCISMIKETKHIISADVLGYTGVGSKDPGKEVYAEIVNSLMEV